MSEDTKKPSEDPEKTAELSPEDLKKVTGGSAPTLEIKGESTDDKHKDWSEIL